MGPSNKQETTNKLDTGFHILNTCESLSEKKKTFTLCNKSYSVDSGMYFKLKILQNKLIS